MFELSDRNSKKEKKRTISYNREKSGEGEMKTSTDPSQSKYCTIIIPL